MISTSRARRPAALAAAALAVVLASCLPPPAGAPQGGAFGDPLRRAVDYLVSDQAADGGWHSTAYGQMRGGAAPTALVLYALCHLPAPLARECTEPIRRGIDFLAGPVRVKGVVCDPDGSASYPTYASALYTSVLCRHAGVGVEEVKLLAGYLVRSQLGQAQGWHVEDLPYGGWDHIGEGMAPPRMTTGADLSVTLFAAEALAAAGGDEAGQALERARIFIERCQNEPGDGGFFFAPDPESLSNKAGRAGQDGKERPCSYGTMTADGIRGLLAVGVPSESPRVQAAVRWLLAHPDLTEVPGFKGKRVGSWGQGLRFYYYASLAKALRCFPPASRDAWRGRLRSTVAALQEPDGSWKNSSAAMREDDPLIATSFAVIALSEAGY